jgi:hypothetical protein
VEPREEKEEDDDECHQKRLKYKYEEIRLYFDRYH